MEISKQNSNVAGVGVGLELKPFLGSSCTKTTVVLVFVHARTRRLPGLGLQCGRSHARPRASGSGIRDGELHPGHPGPSAGTPKGICSTGTSARLTWVKSRLSYVVVRQEKLQPLGTSVSPSLRCQWLVGYYRGYDSQMVVTLFC